MKHPEGLCQEALLKLNPMGQGTHAHLKKAGDRAREWASNGTGRRLRRRQGASQAAIGAMCGVSGAAVSLWEHGRRAPSGEAAERYAEWIEAGLAELAGEET